MDETQKLAMTNFYKEIKHNIETTNPQDKASIAKLEEIKNKSKVFFLKKFPSTFLRPTINSSLISWMILIPHTMLTSM